MSTANATPGAEQKVSLAGQTRAIAANAKPPRVLACVLCQQRKIKCDRKFPCANCIRTGEECIPASTLPRRQRRRRFPERELLERLRYYEGLLRQNNIHFDALHPDHPAAVLKHASPSEDDRSCPEDTRSGEKTPVHSKEAVDLWQAISRVTLDAEDYEEEGDGDDDTSATSPSDILLLRHGENATKISSTHKLQIKSHEEINDYLLFVPLIFEADLSASHPEQVQIFRFWQIYLDNINPLLKVTHTPTLQPRIIDAASNMGNINPTFEALLFSIYSISVVSLDEDECYALFGSPKHDLLARYQSACQQALLKCGLWRFSDLDGLTALYLYLISATPQTDVRCLACILAAAIRIAQRMGIHGESSYVGCTVLEAEMRRRLWWSLISFDYRICELTDYKSSTLVPTWDCKPPLNLNDFELRPEIKTSPAPHEKPTEALFAVVRSELADYVRHSAFHLNFINPSLNTLAQPKGAQTDLVTDGGELIALEKTVESKYLAFCDPLQELHYMTIWTTRGSVARSRLLNHYSTHSKSSVPETDAQRSAGISYAVRMLECDTNLRTSPLSKKFLWFISFYLPALAILYILGDLRKWPASDHAEQAWRAIGDNYEALTPHSEKRKRSDRGIYVEKFSQLVLQAWQAREQFLQQQQRPPEQPPRIVLDVRDNETNMSSEAPSENNSGRELVEDSVVIDDTGDSSMPMLSMNSSGHDGTNSSEGFFPDPMATGYNPDALGQAATDVDVDQLLTEIDWRWIEPPEW